MEQQMNELQALKEENKVLRAQNKEQTQKLYEQHAQIFVQRNRINELESWETIWRERVNVLVRIQASRSWRLVQKAGRALNRLLPPGSVRRTLAGKLMCGGAACIARVRSATRRIERIGWFRRLKILSFAQPASVRVSIIIPVCNQFVYTYQCLQSILDTCGDLAYEIVLADDASTDATRNIQKKVSGIRVVRNEQNLRFLRNCNNAAKSARGEFIVFLNNDTQVQDGWLQSLLRLMDARPDCGMAGSKILFPDANLQEAGGIVWRDGTAWNYGRGQSADKPEFNYVKEVDYISGCSIMIRTALWREIGGFDERFAPAYCEDSDLAFAVRAHGYKVLYQPDSVVVHYEGVSNGTDLSAGQKQYQIENQKKLYQKWRSVLERENYPQAQQVFRARERGSAPCLLMIDHYVPTFDQDAGSRTVYEYIRLFLAKGYRVKFLPDYFEKTDQYTHALQQLGVEVFHSSDFRYTWKDWVRENAQQFDYVFLNRPHISVKYIGFLRQHTRAKVIYYGHDLHFLRETRQYEVTGDAALLSSAQEWKALELLLMDKADISYYPSRTEEEYIHAIDPAIRVKAIPAYIYTDVPTPAYHLAERSGLMFVGGFGHAPNADAVLWFFREIWPIVKKSRPDLIMHVLGSRPTEEIMRLDAPDFRIHGFVSDEELARFYRETRMSVVPLRYGAGIKGKVVEAMKSASPVITTHVGAEGIEGAQNVLAIEDDPAAFAQRILALYDNEAALAAMSGGGCAYVRKQFGPENAWKAIEEDFA